MGVDYLTQTGSDVRPVEPAKIYSGKILDTAASFSDAVRVVIEDIDNEFHTYGPCEWIPRGSDMPVAGDSCVVVFDNQGQPWIACWSSTSYDAAKCDVYRASTQAFTGGVTKVLFDTETEDVSSYFVSTYTPLVAGRYRVDCCVTVAAMTAGSRVKLMVYKSGVLYRILSAVEQVGTNQLSVGGSCEATLDGEDDYLDIYVSHTDGSADRPIQGGASATWMQVGLVAATG